jgi:hypothetical protein
VLGEHRRLGYECRERRSELVGNVRGEASLPRPCLREIGDLRLQGLRHLVERRRPNPELVGPGRRETRVQQPLGQVPRRAAGATHRGERSSCDEPSHERRHDDRGEPPGRQEGAELAEVAHRVLLGEQEVQLGRRSGGTPADDEMGAAGDVEAPVRELTLVDQRTYLRWDERVDRRVRHEPPILLDQDRVHPAPLEALDELPEVGSGPESGGQR